MEGLVLPCSGGKVGGRSGYELRRIQRSLNIIAYVVLHHDKGARIIVSTTVVSGVCF